MNVQRIRILLSGLLCVIVAATAFPAGGILKVTSFPTGAEVWVNGVNTGKVTPMSINLPEGDHTITVQLPGSGWSPDTRTVTIVPGNNDLSVTLLPSFDAERAAREAADAALQAAIDAEAAARIAADQALQNSFDAVAAERNDAARLTTSNVYHNPGVMIPQVLGPVGTGLVKGDGEVFASNPLDFQTHVEGGETATFRLQARDPNAGGVAKSRYTFELALMTIAPGAAEPVPSGFSFNPDGTLTFDPDQRFPGTAHAAALDAEITSRIAADAATLAAAKTYTDSMLNTATAYTDDALAVERAARTRADDERARLAGGNQFTGDQTIAGTVTLSGSGSGIRFPDGSLQTSAVASVSSEVIVVGRAATSAQNGAALREALAQIAAGVSQARIIRLEPGLFDIGSEPLFVPESISIVGSGREASWVRAFPASNGVVITTAGHSLLSDFFLQVQTSSEVTDIIGILAEQSITIDRVRIDVLSQQAHAVGVMLASKASASIDRSNMIVAGTAFRLSTDARATVRDTRLFGSVHGIDLLPSSRVEAWTSIVSGNTAGIRVDTGANLVLILSGTTAVSGPGTAACRSSWNFLGDLSGDCREQH